MLETRDLFSYVTSVNCVFDSDRHNHRDLLRIICIPRLTALITTKVMLESRTWRGVLDTLTQYNIV